MLNIIFFKVILLEIIDGKDTMKCQYFCRTDANTTFLQFKGTFLEKPVIDTNFMWRVSLIWSSLTGIHVTVFFVVVKLLSDGSYRKLNTSRELIFADFAGTYFRVLGKNPLKPRKLIPNVHKISLQKLKKISQHINIAEF